MASLSQSSNPEIPDNHRESWLALLAAAEAYSQKSGCDLAILTACKKFHLSTAEGDGARKLGAGGLAPAGRKWDYSYHAWGQGMLAESARRYMDDIAVLHSTSLLTARRHAPLASGDGGAKLGVDITSDTGSRTVSRSAGHAARGSRELESCSEMLVLQLGESCHCRFLLSSSCFIMTA